MCKCLCLDHLFENYLDCDCRKRGRHQNVWRTDKRQESTLCQDYLVGGQQVNEMIEYL